MSEAGRLSGVNASAARNPVTAGKIAKKRKF
jgi:hypothetical protein